MKKLILTLFFASSAFAALPPLAQSIREMKALLAEPRFYEALGSAEQIKNIVRTENGYLVLTQNYAMNVDIRYLEREDLHFVGPARFEFVFNRPVRLQRVSTQ
jgi:hypothetical protein